AESGCPAAKYERAYLHHLLRIEDAAAWQLLSLHNLRFYAQFMQRLREGIAGDTLDELRAHLHSWTARDREAERQVDA
ncbi:MAG: tRNA guanosine(34) transglycosylase Tgt, partial [Armatimonadota bacterium]